MTLLGVLSIIAAVCEVVVSVASVAATVIDLCKSAGLIQTNENHEQIGERFLAAEEAGITPERFDNDYDKYMQAVNDFDMDNVNRNKWSDRDKAIKAIEVATAVLYNDIGPKAEKVISVIANHADNEKSEFFTAERMHKYIEADKNNTIDIDKCIPYLEGETVGNAGEIRSQLVDVERGITPNKSENEILDVIDYYRD